jgi:hypothetical protein
MQCANHVKQLSLALHNYADAFTGAFPNDGWKDANGAAHPDGYANLSVLVRILPYIEQGPLYNKFNFNAAYGTDVNAKGTDGSGGPFEGTVTIKYFVCPSNSNTTTVTDGSSNATVATTLTNYVGISGGTSTNAAGTSNYTSLPAGSIVLTGFEHGSIAAPEYINNGVLRFGDNTTFATMSDGTSNVFVFSEVTWPNAAKVESSVGPYLATESTWARGGTVTIIGTGTGVKSYNVKAVSRLVGGTSNAALNNNYGVAKANNLGYLGSSHTGGVSIFGLGDGSVRAINSTTDGVVLERAANASDGISVSF